MKMADKISNNGGMLTDVPPSWSEERAKGYFIWSQAVCANLKGASEILDKQMNEIFEKSGINVYSPE